MTVYFSGYVFQDDGDALNGATVQLLQVSDGAEEASTTTDYQSKLVPFYYGQGQSYVLEFYADNIKIFYNNGILIKKI